MKASEAKLLVRAYREKQGLNAMYDRIREAASRGEEHLVLKAAELTEFQAKLLRDNGFLVEGRYKEEPAHDADTLVGWTIWWSA